MPDYDDVRQSTSIKKEEQVTTTFGSSSTIHARDTAVDPRVHGQRRAPSAVHGAMKAARNSTVSSPIKSGTPHSPAIKSDEDVVAGEVTVKAEPGEAPKLSRATSQRVPARPPTLFFDHADKTEEACKVFTVIDRCEYGNKQIGTTEHALECDCVEQWDPDQKKNFACGDNSDCINRATKLECLKDCNCGPNCQNRRFQKRQYANVTVFKTEKKGYGLRANTVLGPGDFIFEYIGEVIGEKAFHRRMAQYDQEKQEHFYFMSLNKGEFVDATKRGNLGRFCNHSCKPNCYVDKWVVGEKLRMGIFAQRDIIAGEELVFNYNVDRYGANPQACFCGEPNCTGFIGGKTQSVRATKLSALTIEALGIDDADDWDIAVSKKPRKKKTGEDDEEYVDGVQPKSMDEGVVTKVMATLMQTKEKWIAVKLLERLQDSNDERVWNRVVRMHGYRILKSSLNNFLEEDDVVLQILDVLHKLPRLTRNKIQDSKIEETVTKLQSHENERISEQADSILKIWCQLEVGYRIPRMKRDPKAVVVDKRRRSRSRSRSRTRSKSPAAPRGPTNLPTGPRSGLPQRPAIYGAPNRPRAFRPPPKLPPLPAGWNEAKSGEKTYYWSNDGKTTWQRPTMPAQAPPPPPPKVKTEGDKLMDIVNGIVARDNAARASRSTPVPRQESYQLNLSLTTSSDRRKDPKKVEPWQTWDESKTKKVYETTLFPIVMHCVKKYQEKIPKDDLKKGAKECAKGIVAQDYKKGRIGNPNKISPDMEKKIKQHIYDYFNRAVKKRRDRHKKAEEARRERKNKVEQRANAASSSANTPSLDSLQETPPSAIPEADIDEEDLDGVAMDLSDNDDDQDEHDKAAESSEVSPDNENDLKRKREVDGTPLTGISLEDDVEQRETPRKTLRSQSPVPCLAPPPPPPPTDEVPMDIDIEVDEDDYEPPDSNMEAEDSPNITQALQREEEEDYEPPELAGRVKPLEPVQVPTPMETVTQEQEGRINNEEDYEPPEDNITVELDGAAVQRSLTPLGSPSLGQGNALLERREEVRAS